MYESTYAGSFEAIRSDMAAVRKNILGGKMSAEDGEAIAKAGHVEVKLAEVDLHARVFAYKVGRNEPPNLELEAAPETPAIAGN